MSKAVLMSIKPQWCELVASGKKTIEVRKTRPKLDTPFKCYIYQSRKTWAYSIYQAIADSQGKVIGEFACNKIDRLAHIGTTAANVLLQMTSSDGWSSSLITPEWLHQTCLSMQELEKYSKGGDLYGWHISDLVIYDEPKELSKFKKLCPAEECENCKYYHAIYYNELPVCNYEHFLKRPPQSWCYVEEV